MNSKLFNYLKANYKTFATILGIVATSVTLFFTLKNNLTFSPELEGRWTITFLVEGSSYKTYIGDRYVYEVYVTQDKEYFSGRGEQILYNGKVAKSHFKIEWDKMKLDKKLIINYRLYGTRPTTGLMELEFVKGNKKRLSGVFHGTAAKTSGQVEVIIN